jgi:hypothetical protein
MRMRSALLPVLALVFGASGCVDDSLSLRIVDFVAVDQTTMCKVSTTGTTTTIQTRGTLDTSVSLAVQAPGYFLVPSVVNNLTSSNAAATGTTTDLERNIIDITGFDVMLEPPADTPLNTALLASDRNYFVPAAGGSLMPGAVNSASVPIVAIPASVVQLMDAGLSTTPAQAGAPPRPLIVHIRPVGDHAGLKINGGFVDFPLDVCRGCLQPVDAMCPAAGYPSTQVNKSGCFPGQDVNITCCVKNSQLLCGSQVPTTM